MSDESDKGRGEACVWMFAYGANTNDSILIGRRNIDVLESCPAVLEGHRLLFDLPGLPLFEPAFANIEAYPGEEVHGVLRRLTRGELERLNRMEGGGHAYCTVEIEVRSYAGARVPALAYRALKRRAGSRPSSRYLGVLLEGARQHGLDRAWQEWLEAVPVAPRVPGQRLVVKCIEELLKLGVPMSRVINGLWDVLDRVRR